jgi:hypothetical protein
MNAQHIFRSMFWKDYRELRAFWLATFLLAVILESSVIATAALFRAAGPPLLPLLAWIILFSAVYALGCAAAMFAGEHESGTFALLETLPAEPRRLLAGRIAFVVTSTLLMLVLLAALGEFLASQFAPQLMLAHVTAILGWVGLLPAELFVWGLLFSFICRRALVAAVLGSVVGAGLLSVMVLSLTGPGPQAPWWIVAFPIRALIVVLVAALDALLATRWLCPEQSRLRRWHREANRPAAPPAEIPAWRRRWLAARREQARLIWHEWRQSWRVLAGLSAVMLAVLGVGCVLVLSSHRHDRYSYQYLMLFLFAGMLLWTALLGACTFHSDWQENRFRFLANCGARPGRVWLSRQAVWFALPGVVVLVVLAVAVVSILSAHYGDYGLYAEYERFRELWTTILLAVCVPLTAHACGQFCSLHLRSSLLAGLASLIFVGVLFCSAAIAWALRVSWLFSWGGGPVWAGLSVLLLTATRLQIGDWMLERTGWRALTKSVLVPVVPLLVLLVVLPFHRVYSVPAVAPGFSVEEFTRPPTPEERATARLYQEAWDAYQPEPEEPPDESNTPSDHHFDRYSLAYPPLSRTEAAWLAANQKAVSLAVQASRRPACAPFAPTHDLEANRLSAHIDALGSLVAFDARRLAMDGKLDEALKHYLAALRIAVHVERRGLYCFEGEGIRRRVQADLLAWAAEPNQTPERIRHALNEVTKLQAEFPSLDREIKRIWFDNQRALDATYLWTMREFVANEGYSGWQDWDEVVRWAAVKWLPWERARARRILNILTRRNLAEFWSMEDSVLGRKHRALSWPDSSNHLYMSTYLPHGDFAHVDPERGFWLSGFFYQTEEYRRVLRLQLALASWRREHGRVPATLNALVGEYLKAVPIDPSVDKPFRYFPEGIPKSTIREVRRLLGRNVEESSPIAGLDPDKDLGPFLWSPAFGSERPYSGDTDTEVYILSCGQIFPVP